MKNYTITVNGTAYDVSVEETGSTGEVKSAPVKKAASKAPVSNGKQGSVKVTAEASGKVFKLDTKPGDKVSRGDTVITLEIMKMETPVVTKQDGTIASIEVTEGQQVEAGTVLATMNA